MEPPDYPANETARLQALQSLNILDTKPEERFDRITRIVQRLFNVPIALVTLIDAERQWFKSCQGLTLCQTPRSLSFCGHAILSDGLLIVSDTHLDQRFCDNPLVTGAPKLRFYAGVPLTLGNGLNLGTLCVADYVPRQFTSEEQHLLVDLGKIAQQELLAMQLSAFDELKQRNAEMTQLSEMNSFLQACFTVEEVCATTVDLMAPLFPGCSGAIFSLGPDPTWVKLQACWGQDLSSQPEFSFQDCWALRQGKEYWMAGPKRPHCYHVSTDNGGAATLCFPILNQGEILGLFYLSTDIPHMLSEAKRQLARMVAEQMALAIANLKLRFLTA